MSVDDSYAEEEEAPDLSHAAVGDDGDFIAAGYADGCEGKCSGANDCCGAHVAEASVAANKSVQYEEE